MSLKLPCNKAKTQLELTITIQVSYTVDYISIPPILLSASKIPIPRKAIK